MPDFEPGIYVDYKAQQVEEVARDLRAGGWEQKSPDLIQRIRRMDYNQVVNLIDQVGLEPAYQDALEGRFDPDMLADLDSKVRPAARAIFVQAWNTFPYDPQKDSPRVRRQQNNLHQVAFRKLR